MGIEIISTDRPDPAAALAEPVMIEIVRHHAFVKQAKRGCGVCGRAKTHIEHAGSPPSMNLLGSGNQFAYQAHKKAWQEALIDLLEQADFPRPLGRVLAEGEVTFPNRRKRDQGNHRFFVEKALGDALTAGGWLPDDDWARYEFGNLTASFEKDVSRTRLLLFPFPLTGR
jgi:hypothetical protein